MGSKESTAPSVSPFQSMTDADEPLHVLDLPQLYQRPAASTLLSILSDLALEPLSWETTKSNAKASKRRINDNGIPAYLTKIISSPLTWIKDDTEREQIWEAASKRLSERSGRSAMGDITRTFRIPIRSNVVPDNELGSILEIELHEPALTADNLGFKTWGSSYLLAKRLTTLKDDLPPVHRDHQILELGAGTGLVGLAAAAIFRTHVVLTDLPDIVPNLEHNCRKNELRLAMQGGTAETAVLDWSKPAALFTQSSGLGAQRRNTFRVILAADPIYSSEHPALLVQTISHHLSKSKDASVFIELPLREAFVDERRDLIDRMKAAGLSIVNEGQEVGRDDWNDNMTGEDSAEVRCWWSDWGWK